MDKIFETYPKIKELIHMSGRDIDSATLKLVEELGEFTSANFGLKSYKKNTPEDLQEEAVDLLQCAMGLYSLVQDKYPFDGKAIMDKKLDKWESKYTEKPKSSFSFCIKVGNDRYFIQNDTYCFPQVTDNIEEATKFNSFTEALRVVEISKIERFEIVQITKKEESLTHQEELERFFEDAPKEEK